MEKKVWKYKILLIIFFVIMVFAGLNNVIAVPKPPGGGGPHGSPVSGAISNLEYTYFDCQNTWYAGDNLTDRVKGKVTYLDNHGNTWGPKDKQSLQGIYGDLKKGKNEINLRYKRRNRNN